MSPNHFKFSVKIFKNRLHVLCVVSIYMLVTTVLYLLLLTCFSENIQTSGNATLFPAGYFINDHKMPFQLS